MPKFDPWSRDLERVRQLCAELVSLGEWLRKLAERELA